MTRLFVYPALALSLGIAVAAQSPSEPSFDVVSVKRNTSSDGARMMRNAPGNLSAFNIPIRQLIQMAFQVQDFQIVGAPDWAATEGYDVESTLRPCGTEGGSRSGSTAYASDDQNAAARTLRDGRAHRHARDAGARAPARPLRRPSWPADQTIGGGLRGNGGGARAWTDRRPRRPS